MTLDKLETDKIAVIEKINTNNSIKRRILELGLIKGTKIKPVLKSICGNPIAYEFRGSLIAIRNEDAKNIIIKLLQNRNNLV